MGLRKRTSRIRRGGALKQPTCGGRRKTSKAKRGSGGVIYRKLSNGGKRKSKRSKRSKKVSSSYNSDKMKDPKLTALCMTCFHRSGKKVKQCVMSLAGRNHSTNSRGRSMIKGKCVKCSGKMALFV